MAHVDSTRDAHQRRDVRRPARIAPPRNHRGVGGRLDDHGGPRPLPRKQGLSVKPFAVADETAEATARRIGFPPFHLRNSKQRQDSGIAVVCGEHLSASCGEASERGDGGVGDLRIVWKHRELDSAEHVVIQVRVGHHMAIETRCAQRIRKPRGELSAAFTLGRIAVQAAKGLQNDHIGRRRIDGEVGDREGGVVRAAAPAAYAHGVDGAPAIGPPLDVPLGLVDGDLGLHAFGPWREAGIIPSPAAMHVACEGAEVHGVRHR